MTNDEKWDYVKKTLPEMKALLDKLDSATNGLLIAPEEGKEAYDHLVRSRFFS